MFQINAILNPSVLDDVLQGLQDEDIQGVTVTNVMGKGCIESMDNKLTEKVMILVLVANANNKAKAMEAIRANAQDIEHGSGKMWVTSIIEAERIRTGEKDIDALSLTTNSETHPIADVESFTAIDTPAS